MYEMGYKAKIMENILIIDDNEDILEIFEQVLVDQGFDVSTANNGNEGIELFKWGRFDLVITDINMPGMSGLDVLNIINDTDLVVPIILMSCDYLPIDAADVKKLGVNAIISKTIDDTTFCNLVRSCLLEDKIYTSKIF
jgi:CheY-like chemotaxis protein